MGYQPRIYGQDPAFLGPKNHKREFKELLWQVETVDGGNVDPVCYETRYCMRHPTEGYLRFDWLMTSFLTMFPAKGHLVLFRDAKGKQTEGKIADDAKIHLYFLSPDMDDLEEKFVYVACEDEDNAYLMIENSRDDKQKQKPSCAMSGTVLEHLRQPGEWVHWATKESIGRQSQPGLDLVPLKGPHPQLAGTRAERRGREMPRLLLERLETTANVSSNIANASGASKVERHGRVTKSYPYRHDVTCAVLDQHPAAAQSSVRVAMPSMLTTAIHNTFIKGAANLTAQLAVQWNATDPQPLDLQRILEFAIFGFIGAHIGYIWHHFLEHQFPTHTIPHVGQPPVIAPGEKDKDASAPLPPPAASTADQGSGGGATKVSWKNVMAKVIADQTVGLCVMITTFLIITNIARVPHLVDVFQVVEEKLWRLVRAGWNIWPIVAMCNFLWVPVRWRVLVSSCVGFLWNIFLSLVSMGPVASTKPGQ
ncbi:Mpv17/PMP22 family protein [Seiridium cupressi]